MKSSEFLCPELVSTDTDDDNNDDDDDDNDNDNLTAAGSEYESRMHTTTATPTFSTSRSLWSRHDCTAQRSYSAAEQSISSAAHSAIERRTMERDRDGHVFKKARGREFPW